MICDSPDPAHAPPGVCREVGTLEHSGYLSKCLPKQWAGTFRKSVKFTGKISCGDVAWKGVGPWRDSELSPILMQKSIAQIELIVNEWTVNEIKNHAVSFDVTPSLE